jgi:hypothetical protein
MAHLDDDPVPYRDADAAVHLGNIAGGLDARRER